MTDLYLRGCSSGATLTNFFALKTPDGASSVRATIVEPSKLAFFPTRIVVHPIIFLLLFVC